MTVYAITDTKKGRTGIAPTYLQTTPKRLLSSYFFSTFDSAPNHSGFSNTKHICEIPTGSHYVSAALRT